MKTDNLLFLTDSYKVSHHKMYQKGLQNIYSYLEARTGAKYDTTVFVGLQILMKKYLEGVVVDGVSIAEGKAFALNHFGHDVFNEKMWRYIMDVHGGMLPIRIKAIPEGTPVPISNVLMTIEATDETLDSDGTPIIAPLVNYLETLILQIWAPITTATIAYNIKKTLKEYFDISVDKENYRDIDFMLHDFGVRGCSSMESAAQNGVGHLALFKGTDNIPAIRAVQHYYGSKEFPAFSVNATEHSIMTALGEEGEFEIVKQLIQHYNDGILSVVADSYNIDRFVDEIGTTFKDDIINRNGKFVVRPDSPRFPGDTPEAQIVHILNKLGGYFGMNANDKGFNTLNPKVGLIYGDGLDEDDIISTIRSQVANNFAANSCVFGMGGGLLQKHNRDTQRFAFKCSSQKVNGEWRDIYKNPLDSSKASKKGRLALIKENGEFKTVSEKGNEDKDLLITVFENGLIKKFYTFDEVRKNTNMFWELS